METKINQNENQFTAAMVFERNSDTNYDEIIKRINGYFMNEFIKKENTMAPQIANNELGNHMSLLAGFAVASGTNRARKAVELALSNHLFDELAFKNANSVLLQISSHLIEMDLDEIGIINDFVQEKANYTANIIMSVNEDENLKEAIAITIILSDLEASEYKYNKFFQ